jgi:hypothetical protein
MDPKAFLNKMYDTKECQDILYRRRAITVPMTQYYSEKKSFRAMDPDMVPFGKKVKDSLDEVTIDELLQFMLEDKEDSGMMYAISTKLEPRKGVSYQEYLYGLKNGLRLTTLVDRIENDLVALLVVCYVLDYIAPREIDIRDAIAQEKLIYDTNADGLTRVNSALFKRDGLIYNKKAYYYNGYTAKDALTPGDSIPGFIRIISDECGSAGVWSRIDGNLEMYPEDYYDYSSPSRTSLFANNYKIPDISFRTRDTFIVVDNAETIDKLTMSVRTGTEAGQDMWEVFVESLPTVTETNFIDKTVRTSCVSGRYYPDNRTFGDIKYFIKQYDFSDYLDKYNTIEDGQSTSETAQIPSVDYHIWTVDSSSFSRDTWYKLVMAALPEMYRKMFAKIYA